MRVLAGVLLSFVIVFCGYVEQAIGSPQRSANDYFGSPVGFGIKQGYLWLDPTGTEYGCSSGTVYHPGVDLNKSGTGGNNDKGEPLYAIADGEVVFADDSHWASLIIKFSFAGKDYYAVYGHSEIDSGSPEVVQYESATGKLLKTFESPRVGMHVEHGQIVGLLWDHDTEAAHLHFEIRSKDHPDPSNGINFCGFYGGKTKSEIEKMNRDPLAFIISSGYIDGACRILDPQWLTGVFCWTSVPVGNSVSCNDGGYHLKYTMYENRTVAVEGSFSDSAKQSYCSHVQDNLNITTYLGSANTILGGDSGGWPGPGAIIGADGQSVPSLPDFITKKVWLVTPWGTETYKFGMNESFDTKAQSANIGDGACLSSEISTITGHFYLSNGHKEDVHSGDGAWRRLDSTTTQCDNLKPGDTHTETKNTVIREWITTPGIYNVVYCADHPQDDHNNGGDHQEKHESNNCSTEAVFEVTADAYVNIPDTDLIVSAIQVKGGATQLPASGITNLQMAIRNIGTVTPTASIRSNYSFCGPLPSSVCVQAADDGSEAGELVPGRDQWEETLAPIPVPATAGSYFIKGCVDYQNAVLETNETNNCSTRIVQVVVPSPDFIVSAFGLREGTSIKAGTRVHPWCTVTNVGGPSPAAMRLAYYINWNVYRDSDAVEAYELCAGCSKKEEVLNNNIKLGDKGTRTYRCCVDYQGVVAEANESNNCATMSFTVR